MTTSASTSSQRDRDAAAAPFNAPPHGPLTQLSENVWRVEGVLPGAPLKRVMTVVRRSDGQLLLHSPIALDAPSMAALDALGPVGVIVVPNGYHRLDCAKFAQRYPRAKVYCPSGARDRVAKVVEVAGGYADVPKDARVVLEEIDGTGGQEGVVLVTEPDGVTLVVNDLVFNMPHLPGIAGFAMKHLTQSSGGPRVSRIARLFLVKDRAKVRAALERLAATPALRRIVVSHHEVIESDAAGALRRVAATL